MKNQTFNLKKLQNGTPLSPKLSHPHHPPLRSTLMCKLTKSTRRSTTSIPLKRVVTSSFKALEIHNSTQRLWTSTSLPLETLNRIKMPLKHLFQPALPMNVWSNLRPTRLRMSLLLLRRQTKNLTQQFLRRLVTNQSQHAPHLNAKPSQPLSQQSQTILSTILFQTLVKILTSMLQSNTWKMPRPPLEIGTLSQKLSPNSKSRQNCKEKDALLLGARHKLPPQRPILLEKTSRWTTQLQTSAWTKTS